MLSRESSTGKEIVADLENGATPILINELPRHRLVPRKNGRPLHLSVFYRWMSKGLESLSTPTGRITTEPALLRFFSRLSGATPTQATRSPARREKQIDRAERDLVAAGL